MSRRRLYIDAVWWAGLYLFWVIVFRRREFVFAQTATVEFCYLLFIAANYYFNVWYNIPRHLHRKQYATFGMLMLAGIVAGAVLRVPVAMLLNRNVFIPGKPQPGVSLIFTNSLLNIGLWVTGIIAVKLMADRVRTHQYMDEVKKQKEQAELDFLNAQFNPHFLFNSINSIYGHIDKHNTTARNMLLTFSEMLRYQLYECNDTLIAIDKELTYISNYVALQKVRKDEGLRVTVDIGDGVSGFLISPLLFIAFIENSFKYAGSGSDPGDFISITFKKEQGHLHFSCINSKCSGVNPDNGHKGIGITNAKRRLALLYPDSHELVIADNDQCYKVNLQIKIDEA